ncbi:MAG: hypothetical protein DHS20C11_11560 [Lysobacteraceae bacterium]|nr:MAG: hypothetical protein DHS20C11_11560 [Xanthomonadaceae bacterium]
MLGFYVPPQDRDYIMIARDPKLIINRGEFSELDNIAHFDILPHQYDGWFAAGFALAEIVDWRELAHIHHPETAKSWQHEGFDAEATSLWLRRLQSDQAGLARTLTKLNLSPNDVGEWSARARVLPEQIPDWVEAEFDWRGAKPWRRLHFEPELAAWWRDEGFSAEEAAQWIALGLTAEQRAHWLNLGFNAAAATYWIDFGVTDPVEAKQWLASNLERKVFYSGAKRATPQKMPWRSGSRTFMSHPIAVPIEPRADTSMCQGERVNTPLLWTRSNQGPTGRIGYRQSTKRWPLQPGYRRDI